LSITPTTAPGKSSPLIRLRPLHREGLKILYKVKDSGSSFTRLAQILNIHPSNISHVVSGRRSSARIEAEIARILGKADWNEVVLEARSEVQKKPVKVIIQEMRLAEEEPKKAIQKATQEDTDNYFTPEHIADVDKRISAFLATKKGQRLDRRIQKKMGAPA
jgi:plasmid maintenance system antidote protein VapI